MVNPVRRTPKKGDRVSALGQNGAFVVSDVDSPRCTAELKLIGQDFTLRDIPSPYGIVDAVLRGASMIDHEKLQKGRGWAYVVGIVVFVVVVLWKLAAR